jgi:hypothetical protein
MPCDTLKTASGITVVCSGRGRKKQCPFCKRGWVSKLCDYPIGHGKTCDAGMCDRCASTMGRQETVVAPGLTRPNDTIDVCPIHAEKPFPEPEVA